MLGLEDYGSDSDTSQPGSPRPKVTPVPAPKVARPRQPKKIAIALPALTGSKSDGEEDNIEPPSKKRKTGAGTSSLLSMLPTPKRADPSPQRILGGAGSGLRLHSQPTLTSSEETTAIDEPETKEAATLFRPTSLAKGRRNISVEDTGLRHAHQPYTVVKASAPDFFSIGSSSEKATPSITPSSMSSISLATKSSAPSIPTYEPPEPTPTDEYPGYYQLPSGQWAAYDVEFYGKFMKKWEAEYNAHVRALEKGTVKGFEKLDNSSVEEVDAMKEMEKAKQQYQERESKKAVTAGARGGPEVPRMTINASKTSGIARSRHQLSTLLKEAYENREALEDRIAQGKRNRKEAGNKYGF